MMSLTRMILALGAATLGACGGSGGGTSAPPPPPAGNTVSATPALRFTPDPLTVNVGDVVTFAFGSVAHNVFFDAQDGTPADIAGSNANVDVQRTFTKAGTYQFSCHIHPGMRGTVVVR